MKRMAFAIALATAAAGLGSTQAQAASVFFGLDTSPGGTVPAAGNANTARSNFLAAISGDVGVEDIDGVSISGGNLTGASFGSTGVTATGSGASTFQVNTAGQFGMFATSGSAYIRSNTGFSITFSEAVSAFGFFMTDPFELNLLTTFTIPDIQTAALDTRQLDVASGALAFWGIVGGAGETFDEVTIDWSGTTENVGFDDLTIGTTVSAVPLPAALPLLAAALGGLGILSRRRRDKAAA